MLLAIGYCSAISSAAVAGGIGDRSPSVSETSDEQLYVTGTVTQAGVECLELKADDGLIYSLIGKTEKLALGMRVGVWGEPVEVSFCMKGMTLSVRKIEPLKD